MQPIPGMQPLTWPGVTDPVGPPGIPPVTTSGFAEPYGPPGIAPVAPSGVTMFVSHGVPSGLVQGGGSAAAGPATANAATATAANNMGRDFLVFIATIVVHSPGFTRRVW